MYYFIEGEYRTESKKAVNVDLMEDTAWLSWEWSA